MESLNNKINRFNQVVSPNNLMIIETKKIMEETILNLNNSLNQVNPIDINNLVNSFDKIITQAKIYNNQLNNWFDAEFFNDKERIFKIINKSDENFQIYQSKNMIVVTE
jgi:hypothetical protein